MGSSRVAFVLAVGGLMVAACSGSNGSLDIGGPQSTGSSSGQAGSGADTTKGGSGDSSSGSNSGSAAGSGSNAGSGHSGGSTSGAGPQEDASAGMDATVGDDASSTMDASPSDTGAADVASDGPGSGDDASPPPDDASDTFSCGPTKKCDGATQYCRITRLLPQTDIIAPINDSGIVTASPYQCLPLPECDAAHGCKCVDPDKTCQCSESMGDVVEDCSTGGVGPTPL